MEQIRRNASFLSFSTLLLVMLVLFQSCTPMGTGRNDQSQYQGGGVDGLRYLTYGDCGGVVRVSNSIVVTRDHQAVFALVQNCQTLPAPQPVDITGAQFAGVDSTLLIYNQQLYDQQINSGTQKVTLQYCSSSSPAVQASIWQTVGDQTTLFGRVSQDNGVDSGILNVDPPAAGVPTHYLSSNGQPSSFDLAVNNAIASVIYSIAGGSQQSVSNLSCAAQSNPSIDDGSANAPAGSAQRPTLLDNYNVRAAWKVAGVDYAVGLPAGTTLKDPTLISAPGVSVDAANQLIRVTQNNVVLDGYDFSLHGGYGVSIIGAANTTITHSFFSGGSIQADAASSNLTVSYNILDGGGASGADRLVYMLGSGSVTLKYNWIRNFPARVLENNKAATVVYKYNLIESAAKAGFAYIYFSGAINYSSVDMSFNTTYQATEFSGGTGFRFDPISGGTLTGEASYNTMIALISGSVKMSQMMAGAGPQSNMQMHDNFMDSRGATAAFSHDTSAGVTNIYSNNFDMNTGLPYTTSP